MGDNTLEAIESLRKSMGDYTTLTREQLNALSTQVDGGDHHVYQHHHDETTEQIELENLPNYAPANENEAKEAIRGDLLVTLGGGRSYVEMRMTELQPLRTPELIYPTLDVTVATLRPTLDGGVYYSMFGVPRGEREFQLIEEGGDWNEPKFEAMVLNDMWTVPEELDALTAYQWRCRDIAADNTISNWSLVGSFNVGNVIIDTPTLTVEGGSEETELSIVLKSSPFNTDVGDSGHSASSWVIFNADGETVFHSPMDENNLEQITVPYGHIFGNRRYTAHVVHHSPGWGASAPGVVEFTTGNYRVDKPTITFDDYRIETP